MCERAVAGGKNKTCFYKPCSFILINNALWAERLCSFNDPAPIQVFILFSLFHRTWVTAVMWIWDNLQTEVKFSPIFCLAALCSLPKWICVTSHHLPTHASVASTLVMTRACKRRNVWGTLITLGTDALSNPCKAASVCEYIKYIQILFSFQHFKALAFNAKAAHTYTATC